MKLAIVFLACFSICTIGFGQHWQDAHQKAQQAYDNSDLINAETLGTAALQVAFDRHGEYSNEAINTLQLILLAQYGQGKLPEAISSSENLVKAIEKSMGKNNKFFAQALIMLGTYLIENSENNKALKLYLSEKTIIDGQYTLEDPDYGYFLSDLAYLFTDASRTEEAIATYIKAVEVLQKTNADHTYLMDNFNSLRTLLSRNNQFEQVIKIGHQQAIISQEPLEMATIAVDMATAFGKLQNDDSAKVYYLKAKEFYANNKLTQDEQYSFVINQLVYLSSKSGDNKEVNQYLQSENLGNDKSTLFNQAVIAQNNGKLDDAGSLYNMLLSLDQKNELDPKDRIRLYDNYSLFNVKRSDHNKASEFNSKAISIGKKEFGNKDVNYLSLVAHQALIEKSFGNNLKAKSIYEELISDIQSLQLTNTELYVDVLSNYALALQQLNDLIQAKGLFAEATTIAEKIHAKKDNLAVLYNNYAVILQQSGDFYKAEDFQLKSLALIGESYGEDHSNYATNLINLGEIYVKQGSFTRADSVFKHSKMLHAEIFGEESPQYAMVMVNATKVDKELGNYSKADKDYVTALKILQSAGEGFQIELAFALNDYALLLKDFGNYALSERYSKNAAEIFKKAFGENNPDYASSLGNLANLYQIQDKYDEAEQILKNVMVIDRNLYGKYHPKYGTTLHNLASLYQRQDKIDEAIVLYQEALTIDSIIYGTNHHSYGNTLYNLAGLYDAREEFDRALNAYTKVLKIMETVYGSQNPEYIYRLYGVARLNQRLKKDDDALMLYRKIAEAYLYQIQEFFPVLSEDQKSLFYAKVNPIFNSYRELLLNIAKKDPSVAGELFDLQLHTKAILLNASNQLRNEVSNSQDLEVKKLYDQLIESKNHLINYYNLSKSDQQKEGVDLGKLEGEVNNIEKLLSQKLTTFASVFDLSNYTWKDIQNNLKDKEVVVEMVRIIKSFENNKVGYAALILAKEFAEPKMIIFNNGDLMEDDYYRLYKNSLTFDVKDTLSYNYYWEPIEEITSRFEDINFSPDGIYNKLSLNTLYNKDEKKYLIDSHLLTFISSPKDILKRGSEIQNKNLSVSLIGYPIFNTKKDQSTTITGKHRLYERWMTNISLLPGTKKEVNNLSEIFEEQRWQITTSLELAASEQKIKSLNSPKVLHIATHGYFSEDISYDVHDWKDKERTEDYDFNPLLRSGLLFTNAETTVKMRLAGGAVNTENDGILTAYEAMNLNLSGTDLVVLSACETGLGEVKNGEGVYGLQRAFLISGANNVIMSLWKVDDAITQELMHKFYTHWLTTGELHVSLRKAELEIKAKYEDPSLWGAFVINGL